MVQHTKGVRSVEALIRKSQVLCVCYHKLSRQTINLEPLPCNLNAARSKIDPGDYRPSARELKKIRSSAAADLDQALAAISRKRQVLLHPWRSDAIPVVFYLVEVFTRAEFQIASDMGPTGVVRPLLAGPPFELIRQLTCRRRHTLPYGRTY